MTKIITHVAIIHDGILYSLPEPYRHHHVLQAIVRLNNNEPVNWNNETQQGFLDRDGNWQDRVSALALVLEHKQPMFDDIKANRLFSENVWTTPGNWQAPIGTPERNLYDHNESFETIDKLLKISRSE